MVDTLVTTYQTAWCHIQKTTMGFAGYVSVCVQLHCVGFHCLSLHVSPYKAIFKCVGYFIFICLKDSASLFFFFFSHVVTLCTFPFVFFLCCSPLLISLFLACVFVFAYTLEDGHVGCNM
jgi:hypothetical protein